MEHKRVPYHTILAAKNGDPEAMDAVLRHFDRLINYHAQCTDGQTHTVVDVEVKERIQERLMLAIVYSYDPTRLPDGETLEEGRMP